MTTLDQNNDQVGSDQAKAFARDHPGLVRLGRAGWVAKGVVYTLTGVLALAVALQSTGSGSGGEEASQSGAIATIADQPAGAFLLIVITAGLALYVAWRLVSVLLPADNDAHAWVTRAGYLLSAATYTLLGWSAISFARRPGTSEGSEDARVEQLTREALANSGGRVAVFIVGAVIIGAGAYFLYKGGAATFESDLAPGSVGPISHHTLVVLGQAGWIGRGLMMGVIGFFIARAAVQFDPDDAVGLDGALRRVADSPFGTALIVAVAVGLIMYGIFCALSSPKRLLVGAD